MIYATKIVIYQESRKYKDLKTLHLIRIPLRQEDIL